MLHPRSSSGPRGRPVTCAVAVASASAASCAQLRRTVTGAPVPATASVTATSGAVPAWRLRQPALALRGPSDHRCTVPVSASSTASAKLDFPDPLRPATTLRPGPGASLSTAGAPIPRNPATVTADRNTAAASRTSGGADRPRGDPVAGIRVTAPTAAARASSPSTAASTRSATASGTSASASRSSTRSARVGVGSGTRAVNTGSAPAAGPVTGRVDAHGRSGTVSVHSTRADGQSTQATSSSANPSPLARSTVLAPARTVTAAEVIPQLPEAPQPPVGG